MFPWTMLYEEAWHRPFRRKTPHRCSKHAENDRPFDPRSRPRKGLSRYVKRNILLGLGFIASLVLVGGLVAWTPTQEIEFADLYQNPEPFDINRLNDESILADMVISSNIDAPFQLGCRVPDYNQTRANAVLVMLARNSELDDVVKSMVSMERHFNQWYNYPWVFLNDMAFDEKFKTTVAKYTNSTVEFGQVPPNEWNFKPDVNPKEVHEYLNSQGDREVLYGNMESYHKMCRFYSGYFYKHELIKKRDWYWRVEPDVEFYCDVTYDPFIEMEKRNKKYGFNVFIEELWYTVPSLFRETKAFIKANGIQVGSAWNLFTKSQRYVRGKNEADYYDFYTVTDVLGEMEDKATIKKYLELKDKKDSNLGEFNGRLIQKIFDKAQRKPKLQQDQIDGENYNWYHFWSNFEIARTDIFNSPQYEAFFNHLDQSGGFYKERWGDAPVHSLAIGMLLNLEDIHYFRDIGYAHTTITHCPKNSQVNQIPYESNPNYSRKGGLFNFKYWRQPDTPTAAGVGCRCRCPLLHQKLKKDVEERDSNGVPFWAQWTSNSHYRFDAIDTDYWELKMEEELEKYLENGGELGKNEIHKGL